MVPTSLLLHQRKSCYWFLLPVKIHCPQLSLKPQTLDPVAGTITIDDWGWSFLFLNKSVSRKYVSCYPCGSSGTQHTNLLIVKGHFKHLSWISTAPLPIVLSTNVSTHIVTTNLHLQLYKNNTGSNDWRSWSWADSFFFVCVFWPKSYICH
jgi:hypothetical protein